MIHSTNLTHYNDTNQFEDNTVLEFSLQMDTSFLQELPKSGSNITEGIYLFCTSSNKTNLTLHEKENRLL